MLDDRDYMRDEWRHGQYTPRWHDSSVVKKLIIVNVVVFVLQKLTQGHSTPYSQFPLSAWGGGVTSYLWLSVPTLVEFWRFGTYMFVHGGWMHLFLNMWALFLFGKPVEQRTGSFVFMKLYLLSGIIGALSWLIFNLNSSAPVIGASGAVFGVMAAAAMLFPNMQIMLLFPPVILKVKTLVICLAIIDILMLSQMHSGIAHLAHLGGLLGGFLFIRKFLNESQTHRRNRETSPFNFNQIYNQLAHRLRSIFNSPRTRPGPDFKFVGDDDIDDDEVITTEIDPILDKIGKFGMKSLTQQERRILEIAREKLKDRS